MNPLKWLRIQRRDKRKIEKQRDAILKEVSSMSAEAKRIRGLPRDEVDALIAETVGVNSNRMRVRSG